MSQRVFHIHKVIFFALILGTGIGCTSQPPIVADPPEHTHTSPELVPWEEDYARMRPKPEVFEEDLDEQEQRAFKGNLEQQPEGEGVLDLVADVIAFPFRGVGWLLQQVF